ncbi:MAG: phenylalanine--tRNA ligase subunit alpha [Candidatus Melainabacteria bacterium RIFCSPLOWO2_02_FULL_35_15]|nr:MAG: phenylalanine--tRNA ligase subunit alpha [Candidatus Melainabacteria bacterium RIFCSPLOWO2_12_FULL_35_11]OGI13055.1 MAG: phenylalanine--tRNA ligase subunit alpha [Candidatus Melainabacteria bacterium RIFCSPLOWO2_02_FULL_35_15]
MINTLEAEIDKLKKEIEQESSDISNLHSLESFRIKYLGEKSFLIREQNNLKILSKDERPVYGKLLNDLKNFIQSIYDKKKLFIEERELEDKLSEQKFDITLPGAPHEAGHEHPLSIVTNEIVEIFNGMGFTVVQGPEVETEFYNFTALNTPFDHPARDEQDTFYTNIAPHVLLRSHTSTIQIRAMEKMKPPLRVLAHGRVYRNEEINARKMPFFHQLEILAVEKDLTFGNMKWVLNEFLKNFFGKEIKTRFRPDFFPFTEPSAELDAQCPFCGGAGCGTCGNKGWLELLGCGMVDPNVLKAVDINPDEWIGFAAGLGLERFTMLKYKIPDIRYFFTGDLRFLKQF